METFLLDYCLTGDQMTVLACVSKSAKLSGCQHTCGARVQNKLFDACLKALEFYNNLSSFLYLSLP